MAKLRHIAIAVSDVEESAKFYEHSFGFTRVRESKAAVAMTDGLMSLVLLHLPSTKSSVDERGAGFIGVHHIGFQVDDLNQASDAVENAGGAYHGQIGEVGKGPDTERKYRDPDGVIFDIVNIDHAREVWRLPKPGV